MNSVYQKVADEIKKNIKGEDFDNGNIGPLLVRLAWHASGTYSTKTGDGGSDGGTMRFYTECKDPANAGLHLARAFLEPIKLLFPDVSYGDLWTLAGVVAIQEMGGPSIPWFPGRVDKKNPQSCPPNGRLPDAAQGESHIREVFNRMGFNDQEIVALIGAHVLGECHRDRSGFVGKWTHNPTRFSNSFFSTLLREKWSPHVPYLGGPTQFKNEKDTLMMLPSDMAFLNDANFKQFVELYAKDKEKFFTDFSKAFSKLLALGVKNPGKEVILSPSASI